ncbi:Smad nuclear-interacting protein 1 [Mactra antiquata]
MVKERRRRSSSYSDDEDNIRKQHMKRDRPRSPDTHHKRKKHSHKHHWKDEEDIKPRIKADRDSSDSESEYQRKQERHHHHHRQHSHSRSREDYHGKNERVRVKQEPLDSDEEMQQQRAERRQNDRRRQDNRRRREHLTEDQKYGRPEHRNSDGSSEQPAQPKVEPNFELSGKLTEDTNTYKGVVIKYNEPPEARKPKKRWRLYPFKNDEALKPFHMHRQSAYLFGRDRLIADIPVDHPSCSKQHAVYQYRMVPYEKEDGRRAHKIAPYIIDLESANGTFVNNKKIEARRYVELIEKDVIKFGFSSREYVLLHDKSNTQEVESGEES